MAVCIIPNFKEKSRKKGKYYDALNRLVTEDYNDIDDSNDFEHDYIYDLVGNRLERQVIAGDGNDTIYTYNDSDQLILEFTDANTHYTYNANGSVIQEANDVATLRTFTYNYRNRLEDVNDGTNLVSYTYNPSGIRVQSTVNASSTEFLIDPYNHTGYAQVFKEIGDSNTVFVIGHDVIAQATGSNNPKYFLYDGHGSVRHLANNSGAIVESYNYDAYGNAHGFNASSASTNLLYTGEWYDSDATQYYLRARWYSPTTGRFNRIDPFAGNNRDPQSLHKYLYVHCNPIMKIDPSGEFIGGITGIICSFAISTWTRTKNAAVSLYAKYKIMNKARMLAVFANGSINAAINVYSGPESVSKKMRAAIGFTAGAIESWLVTYEYVSPWIANSIGAAIQSTANEAASSDEFFTRKTLTKIATTVAINGLASAYLQGYDGGAKEEIEKFLIVLDLNLWTGLWQQALDSF